MDPIVRLWQISLAFHVALLFACLILGALQFRAMIQLIKELRRRRNNKDKP